MINIKIPENEHRIKDVPVHGVLIISSIILSLFDKGDLEVNY